MENMCISETKITDIKSDCILLTSYVQRTKEKQMLFMIGMTFHVVFGVYRVSFTSLHPGV